MTWPVRLLFAAATDVADPDVRLGDPVVHREIVVSIKVDPRRGHSERRHGVDDIVVEHSIVDTASEDAVDTRSGQEERSRRLGRDHLTVPQREAQVSNTGREFVEETVVPFNRNFRRGPVVIRR